jgi:hypothetical protein
LGLEVAFVTAQESFLLPCFFLLRAMSWLTVLLCLWEEELGVKARLVQKKNVTDVVVGST